MKVVRNIVSCLLVVSVLASLTACGKSTPNAKAGSEAKGPVTLSILIGGDNTPPSTSNVLKQITKETDIAITPMYVPNADYSTKLNTLVASKSLPDIFYTSDPTNAVQFKQNGAIADLTELVPKYMTGYYPDAKDVLSKNPLNTDGKIYAVFSLMVDYAANMNIRTDWLKNVGLSMPTDLDSLYNVLDAFTNKDPDKDGKKDTFGLSASIIVGWENFSTIFGAYGVPSGKPIIADDGTVTTFMKAPNYLEAVKYFRKLYENGLIDPDFATVPAMTSYGKLWNGQCGAIDFRCVGPTNNWMPSRYTEKVTPTFDFATVKGPDGEAGLPIQYPDYLKSVMVSSQCKNPDAAARLLDFFYSEKGDELLRLGVEGLHFKWTDKENGQYEMIKPYDDDATNRNDGVFVYWQPHLITPVDNAEVRTFNKQTQEGVALASKNSTIPWAYIYTPFEASKTYGANLSQIEKEVFCTLITTKGDVEAEYKKGVARWDDEGGKTWEKEATEAYKSQQ